MRKILHTVNEVRYRPTLLYTSDISLLQDVINTGRLT